MYKYRVFILLFLVFIVGALSFWLSRAEKSVSLSPPLPPLSPTPPSVLPIIPSFVVTQSRPSYKEIVDTGVSPKTMSTYIVRAPQDTRLTALRLASAFRKTAAPKALIFSGNTHYSWSTDTDTFIIGGVSPRFSYSVSAQPGSSLLENSDEGYKAEALRFLKQYELLPRGATLSEPEITYFSPVGSDPIQTIRGKATVVRLDYRLLLDSLPLYMGPPDVPSFSFRYDANKTLLSFTGAIVESIVKKSDAEIVDRSRAQETVYSRGGLVFALSPEDVNSVQTKQYTFNEIAVKELFLAHYLSRGTHETIPIYVFRGEAKQAKTNKIINTVTFLPAVANQ